MAISDQQANATGVFEEFESAVRSYCRGWPTVFDRASGARLYDESGRSYLDCFSGAGALNYGHNPPALRRALIDYLLSDRVVHSLDMYTSAKRDFLLALQEIVLEPRGLHYHVQFPGPAGTNAVEAALKLARKATGRRSVVCFSGGFHGTSLGALAVTTNAQMRGAAGVPLEHTTRLPFDASEAGSDADLTLLDLVLEDRGEDAPAAVILETVQGEGGLNVANPRWLRAIAQRCRAHGIVLIVDDVQMGCGRTGPFFSFEPHGIEPDIVCLSKSISGYGLPLALTLIRPELDVWEPGDHNGTFRGFNPALVTGAAALRVFWRERKLEHQTIASGVRIESALEEIAAGLPVHSFVKGRGMARGLAFPSGEQAARVARRAFELGLLVERAGPDDEVVKLMPPLTISERELDEALAILAAAAVEAVG
jgi:diaminobutyrate-2-oxoglutarate transaminase